MKTFSTIADITSTGTDIKVYNKGNLKDFYKLNKGKRVTLQVNVIDPADITSTNKYIEYVMFPMVQSAMYGLGNHMTINEVSIFFREQCPYCYEGDRLLELNEMTKDKLVLFISWVKQFSAENLDYVFQG